MSNDKKKARGVLAWFLQRITAILLAYFLFWHIVVLHYISTEKITFEKVYERLNENITFWYIFYFLFIPSVVFHGLNGLYGVILDYNPSDKLRKILLIVFWIVGLVLTYIGLRAILIFLN